MRKSNFKSSNQLAFSKVADQIAASIRKSIIQKRKNKSTSQNLYLEEKNKIKTKADPQANFWTNPYKTQKNKWRISTNPSFSLHQKQQIYDTRKQQLQNFKGKLKTELRIRKQRQQIQVFKNNTRVKQIRQDSTYSRQQKISMFIEGKQKDADTLRLNLERKKFQAGILKRQKQLEQSYSRWHRQQQKLAKHRNKLISRQNLKTTE